MENMAINLIIDDTYPDSQIFIEIETDEGKSMRIGEDTRTSEGYRKIRITTGDIIHHESI